jgi:hypothetical protein
MVKITQSSTSLSKMDTTPKGGPQPSLDTNSLVFQAMVFAYGKISRTKLTKFVKRIERIPKVKLPPLLQERNPSPLLIEDSMANSLVSVPLLEQWPFSYKKTRKCLLKVNCITSSTTKVFMLSYLRLGKIGISYSRTSHIYLDLDACT